uniref:Uncharacterized protein n=1 Tax=Arion vulgaris TaxID=1028688 RepID=A0A0B7BSV9_9EUPU
MCQAVGLPTPEISWYRNYKEVYDGRKIVIRHEATNLTLIIKNVEFADAGDIECQARNKYGAVSIRAKLHALAAPQIELPDRYGMGLRFCRGDTIKVRIPISGTPIPKTTWSRGHETLEVGSRKNRVDIAGTNLHTTLIIEDCIKSDEGVYSLEIENQLGSAKVEIPIAVVEPPDPPKKPDIQEADKHSVDLSWEPPEYDGGSPITGYVVERCDPITRIWRWALTTSQPFCTVACLEEHGEHRFRVMAENRFGVSEPSKESEVVITREVLPAINYDELFDEKFLGSHVDVNCIQGDVLGKYIICEELGRGAFGVVHRAVERATGKNWAAKFIHCRPQDKDVIRHEIDIMNRLHHPKLLQLHEAFDQRGEMVMILELLSGGELFDRLVEKEYTLTEEDCITYMKQICEGVQHMHHSSVLHLDLKPENIMCVTKESNDVKIIDFGLAQRLEEGKSVKVLFGTAEFCAPEIINYEPVSFSTDMWSLGVVTYVLLSGYSPFAGDDNHQTFQFVNQADYDFDDEVWEHVSDDAKDFIKHLLIKDKKQRMTIDEALNHPWLNGSTQKKLTGQPLSTAHHKDYRTRTKHKEDELDVLPIGRLSRDSAVMRKEGDQGIVMRNLVMEMPEHAPSFLEELTSVKGFEGSRAQLACKVIGKPTPKVSWLKNGQTLPEDNHHHMTFKDGEATLQISELVTEDSGTYTCQAVNDLGETDTSATLNVEEVRHRRKRLEDEEAIIRLKRPTHVYDVTVTDTNIAPEFNLPLVDQTRSVGEEVTFTVTVTCRPEPDVIWYHGSEKVSRSNRVSLHHDKGVYRLNVLNLTVKDAGEWRCQAINSYGEAWCDCDLKVIEHIPDGHTKPRFVKELKFVTATQGSLIRLECAVTGNPKPSIKWFKDHKRIDTDAHFKIRSYEDGTNTVVIESADVEDTGSYMCVAENDAGSVSTETKIRVHKVYDQRPTYDTSTLPYDDQRQQETWETKKYRAQVPPDFTAKLKNRTTPEGTTVRLNCSVTGIPEPSVRWLKDDKEIFDGPDYTLRNNYGLLSLEIVYCKQSLSGKYSVEASNSAGTVSCSCTLEVEGEEDIEGVDLYFHRPKFLAQIEDIYVNEGENATFTCIATGKPMPVFKWQRDMISITSSKRVESEWDNQGHARLTLKSVKPSDGGLYYCVAQSRAGRAKCSAYLHVKAKSPSPVATKEALEYARKGARDARSVEGTRTLGAPPSLSLMLPRTLDVVLGESLKLDCAVQGYPIPLVTWHKGDRELVYSQRHRIILCGTLHTLEIPQVMALDKGEYIVRATNTYGTVESSCYVNILPKGSKVSTPPDYRREAMRDAAKPNIHAPFFIKHLPKTIDVMQGIDVRLDCILRRGIELVRWSSSQSPSQDLEKTKKDLAEEGFRGQFIPLEARSQQPIPSHGDETRSDPEKRLEYPSFLTTPQDLVRSIGSEAVFECSTAGNPQPEVKWYKDGRLLIATQGVKMTSIGNKHQLELISVLISDEGEYVCKANNLAGTKSCGAVLTIAADSSQLRPSRTQQVEADQQPPLDSRTQGQSTRQEVDKSEKLSFKQPLPKTTNAGHGDDVHLTCEMTSATVASIKWEFDGRELPEDPHYSVSSDNVQKLTIHSVTEKDSGKYTCVVIIKDGDLIHTSTKLTVLAAETKGTQEEEDFKPHFTKTLQDTTVKDGEGLTLECDIEGNPRPQISWYRDDEEIFDSQDFQISMIGCHCKLQISEAYPEDEGEYGCKAVNNLGEAMSTCFVAVDPPHA